MGTYLISRVESDFLHAADDQLLRVIRIDRVDQNNAVLSRQRP